MAKKHKPPSPVLLLRVEGRPADYVPVGDSNWPDFRTRGLLAHVPSLIQTMEDSVSLFASSLHIVRHVVGDWPTPAEERVLLPVDRLETMTTAIAAGGITPTADSLYFALVRLPPDPVRYAGKSSGATARADYCSGNVSVFLFRSWRR